MWHQFRLSLYSWLILKMVPTPGCTVRKATPASPIITRGPDRARCSPGSIRKAARVERS